MSVAQPKNRPFIRRILATSLLGVFLGVNLVGLAAAQSVTKGYGSDQVLQRGMIVGQTKANTTKVEPIDITRLAAMLGVVVNPNDSPITISSDTQNIFVATTGRYEVLVSDQEGAIHTSDYVTLSSVAGIGMKATEYQSRILGRALSVFDGTSSVLSSTTLKDVAGKERTVHIGRIAVDINVGRNPLSKETNGAPILLNQVSSAIVGKTVSAARLYLATIIFVVGTLTAGAILYAGIRSSITAIGRNPLSRRSVLRSMLGVAFTSLIIFLICVIGVYLLLRL